MSTIQLPKFEIGRKFQCERYVGLVPDNKPVSRPKERGVLLVRSIKLLPEWVVNENEATVEIVPGTSDWFYELQSPNGEVYGEFPESEIIKRTNPD